MQLKQLLHYSFLDETLVFLNPTSLFFSEIIAGKNIVHGKFAISGLVPLRYSS